MKRFLSILLVVCLLATLAVPVGAANVASGSCGPNLTWTLDDDGTLYISGTGAMNEFSKNSDAPWYAHRNAIKTVVVATGVTTISDLAFQSYSALSDVYVGDTVTEIGYKAFADCTNLLTASIGEGIDVLDGEAFSGCTGLLGLYLGALVDEIDSNTFYRCNQLTHVFYNGTKSQWRNNVTIEAGNANIKEDAEDLLNYLDAPYAGVCGEATWTFNPKTFTLEITGEGRMDDYDADSDRPWDEYYEIIRSAKIGEGVTYIGARTFRYIENLYEVEIASTVTEIGEKAFNRTNGLKDVYYLGAEAAWKNNVTVGSNNEMLTAADIHYADDCEHNSVTPTYTSNGDETHTVKEVCGLCGIDLSTPIIVDCGDEDADGRCDMCGGDVAPEVCTHPNATYDYVQNKDGVNHSKWLSCADCGAYLDLGVANCVDENADGRCDFCKETISNSGEGGEGGGENTCTHADTKVVYEANDGKTHLVRTVCNVCSETVSSVSEACTDSDKDFVCDVCEADMEYVKFKYDVSTGTLTVYGNTAMDDYASVDNVPWAAIRDSITKVVIEEGVTSVGKRAFCNCTKLAEITIPASLTLVDNYAFYKAGLQKVYYGGTEAMWSQIVIGRYNDPLLNAVREATCLHENTSSTITPNGDKTHTITAVCECGEVLEPVTEACTEGEAVITAGEGAHTTTVKCTVCEQTLTEETVACTDTTETIVCNNDRTHTVTVTCNTCEGTVSDETVACADGEDADGKCDVCDFDLTCSHPSYVKAYNSNGDHETHNYAYNCQICGEEVDVITANLACYGEDGETCDLCGQDYSCQHYEEDLRTETEYHPTEKTEVYTHNQMTVVYCDGEDCDLPGCIFSSEIVEEQNCADQDGDDKCDLCGRNMVCEHANKTETTTHNGHNTHQYKVVCNICGDTLVDVEMNCVYGVLGGACALCKEACGHEYSYSYNVKADAEQHYVEAKCDHCGYELDTVTENCTDADIHDGLCDDCGDAVACKHQQKTSYTDNENGTHTIVKTCDTCELQDDSCEVCAAYWEVTENVACADGEDEDLACDDCGAEFGEAAVDTVAYATFSAAMEAAQDGDTVALLKNVTLTEQLIIDKDVTLDFGGYELTTYPVEDEYCVLIKNNLTIEDGIFNIVGQYGLMIYPDAVVVIEGGEFNASENNDYIIGNWGTLTINGGQFNGVYCAVNNFAGTTTITGGTFSTEEYDYTGEYESSDLLADTGMTVYGGTYSKPVAEELLAEGYVCKEDGFAYVVEKVVVKKVNVASYNMTLGNELKLNFVVKKSDVGSDLYTAKIYHEGKEPIEVALTEYNATYMVASRSVAAKEMTDQLSIELYDADGNLVSEPYSKSIKDYAEAMLARTSDAMLKALLVDMLNYGAEAQKYFSYNTDKLANADLTEEQQGFATGSVEVADYRVKGTNYAGTVLSLEDSILLGAVFNGITNSDVTGLTATVEFTNYRDNVIEGVAAVTAHTATHARVVVNQIVLADSRSVVTVKLYKDGELVGECADSVESYAARSLAAGQSTIALNDTIMKFSTSAKDYLLK